MRNRDKTCGECMRPQTYDVSSQDFLCNECLNEKEQEERMSKIPKGHTLIMTDQYTKYGYTITKFKEPIEVVE